MDSTKNVPLVIEVSSFSNKFRTYTIPIVDIYSDSEYLEYGESFAHTFETNGCLHHGQKLKINFTKGKIKIFTFY